MPKSIKADPQKAADLDKIWDVLKKTGPTPAKAGSPPSDVPSYRGTEDSDCERITEIFNDGSTTTWERKKYKKGDNPDVPYPWISVPPLLESFS